MSEDSLHKELTERIIGAAMEVHRDLRNGLDETSQMIGYLKITGLRVGLLINFKHASIQIKRITI